MSTDNLNMTLKLRPNGNIVGFVNGDYRCVSTKHPAYDALRKAYEDEDIDEFYRIYTENILDLETHEKYEIEEKMDIKRETVEYRGRTIDDPALVEVIKNYGTTCDALKRFVNNMFLNPKWESIEQLARFLKHNHFPLTEDGCFLGYKAVRSNMLDKYSGTLDNSVGRTVTMPRANVTFDPKSYCSAGLHVGTYSYAETFGGGDDVMIIVKVNPAHVVSVPYDCDGEKLRTSSYTVVGLCEGLLDVDKIFSLDGRELSTQNYFSDLRDAEFRRRRARVTPVQDDYDDDDEDDMQYYVCTNCGEFREPKEDVEDHFGLEIAFCPVCGDELCVE